MLVAATRMVVASVALCAMATVCAQHGAHRAAPGNSESGDLDPETAYRASQDAIGGRLSNHALIDKNGNMLKLSDLLDRPTVVSMVYTSCYHVCPTLTHHLREVVEIGRQALGADSFNVVTIGFDTAVDTPQRMSMFAAERGIDDPRWYFVSVEESTLSGLAAELGFVYRPSPRGFDHLMQTTLLDAGGRVTNQIYGIDFDTPLMVEPLKHLLRGQVLRSDPVQGWWRQIKLLCTVYDPTSGKYHFDYSLIIAVVLGAVILFAVGVFVVRSWRYTNRFEI